MFYKTGVSNPRLDMEKNKFCQMYYFSTFIIYFLIQKKIQKISLIDDGELPSTLIEHFKTKVCVKCFDVF